MYICIYALYLVAYLPASSWQTIHTAHQHCRDCHCCSLHHRSVMLTSLSKEVSPKVEEGYLGLGEWWRDNTNMAASISVSTCHLVQVSLQCTSPRASKRNAPHTTQWAVNKHLCGHLGLNVSYLHSQDDETKKLIHRILLCEQSETVATKA